MTQIARVAKAVASPLTPQMIADLSLFEDQAMRAALRAGNAAKAAEHEAERDRLLTLLENDDDPARAA